MPRRFRRGLRRSADWRGWALEHLAGEGLTENAAGFEVAGVVDAREKFHAARFERAGLEAGGVIGQKLAEQRRPRVRIGCRGRSGTNRYRSNSTQGLTRASA